MVLPQNKIALMGREGFYYLKIGVTAIGLLIVMALVLIEAPTNNSPAPSAPVVQPSQVPHW